MLRRAARRVSPQGCQSGIMCVGPCQDIVASRQHDEYIPRCRTAIMASDYDKSDLPCALRLRALMSWCVCSCGRVLTCVRYARMCALCSQVCVVLASVRCARMCALCSHVGAVLACVRCARLCPLCVRACEASRMCARSRTCSASADARASPHPPYERRGRGRVLACGHVLACAGAHWRRVSCCWLADGCVANLNRGNEESCDMRACVRVWSLHSAQ